MTELKTVLTSGPTIGGWCGIPSAFSAELMGTCGWDWVCVDMQHGLIGYEHASQMLEALSITQTPAFVRVPWNQPDYIMKALDAGAQGVIVPMVNSPEDVRSALNAMKYPPIGQRSWGPVRAELYAEGYSSEFANQRTVLAAMIETTDGFKNMEEIMAVPGLDAIYVGPADLALTHGFVPTLAPVHGSEHEHMILEIVDCCRRHSVLAGLHCDSVETVVRWRDAGYQWTTISSDAALMRSAAMAALRALRGRSKPEAASTSAALQVEPPTAMQERLPEEPVALWSDGARPNGLASCGLK